MKRITMLMAGATVCAGIFAGCNSTPINQVKADYERFQNKRPKVAFVKTGDTNLDNTAKLAANVYGKTVKYVDEYVAATNNHREVLGFMNEVTEEVKKNKVSQSQACSIVLERMKKQDVSKPAEEQMTPKVIAGLKAINNLKPQNKLRELVPLLKDAAGVASKATSLVNSFTSFSPAILKKAQSAANVSGQAKFTVDALNFLIRQYQCVQDSKAYMQK